ncbi:MAG: HAD family hydrolase [Nitrospirae bacterium]|nr:HAD family hydrolase [Nitrospirota bacterium]
MALRRVFLIDVDNTLLDNDRLQADLVRHLEEEYGSHARERYWTIFTERWNRIGYADYLGALQLYREEELHDPRLLRMSSWMVDYPFATLLHPRALDVVRILRKKGAVVILSDGDAVFQPRKIERSGLWEAAEGHVLVYIHKEQMVSDIEERYPADHYVLVDDKIRILTAFKAVWQDRVTTILPRQGHYAEDRALMASCPPPDLSVGHIADILDLDFDTLCLPSSEKRSRP